MSQSRYPTTHRRSSMGIRESARVVVDSFESNGAGWTSRHEQQASVSRVRTSVARTTCGGVQLITSEFPHRHSPAMTLRARKKRYVTSVGRLLTLRRQRMSPRRFTCKFVSCPAPDDLRRAVEIANRLPIQYQSQETTRIPYQVSKFTTNG